MYIKPFIIAVNLDCGRLAGQIFRILEHYMMPNINGEFDIYFRVKGTTMLHALIIIITDLHIY